MTLQTRSRLNEASSVILSNGIGVANFSSPHPFNFTDGTVLNRCDPERVKAGSLNRDRIEEPFPGLENKGIVAEQPVFSTTPELLAELREVCDYWDVDVVLIPFPLLDALRREDLLSDFPKVATVCVANRETKEIHIDRFCR